MSELFQQRASLGSPDEDIGCPVLVVGRRGRKSSGQRVEKSRVERTGRGGRPGPCAVGASGARAELELFEAALGGCGEEPSESPSHALRRVASHEIGERPVIEGIDCFDEGTRVGLHAGWRRCFPNELRFEEELA